MTEAIWSTYPPAPSVLQRGRGLTLVTCRGLPGPPGYIGGSLPLPRGKGAGRLGSPPQFSHQRNNLLFGHLLVIGRVHAEGGRAAAGREALDRPQQRHRAIGRRLARHNAEFLLQSREDASAAPERAREVVADLDNCPPHRLGEEHRVEGGEAVDVVRRDT